LLLTAIGSIVGFGIAAYTIYEKLEKETKKNLESHFKDKKEALESQMVEFETKMDTSAANKFSESRKLIEAEFRSANAKIRGSYGYLLWVQLKHFRTTQEDVYKELLPLFLNVVESTVVIARKLPEEEQYLLDKLEHLINAAYFFAYQPERKNYHGKAIDIVKEVRPYLEKYAIKGNGTWSELLESIVFVEYTLKIKNAAQTKKALEELFSYMENAWVEQKKKDYPLLFDIGI
jgi:hypothetical protein